MRWLVLAILLIASPAQASVLWFAGCETGTMTDEVTNCTNCGSSNLLCSAALATPPSGAYYYATTANSTHYSSATGLGLTTIYVRTWFRLETITVATNDAIMLLAKSDVSHFDAIYWRNDVKHLAYSFDNGAFVVTGATTVSTGVFYLIEVKCVISATVGGCELKLNGNVEFSSFATNNSAITAYDRVRFSPGTGVGTLGQFYDDLMVCDTSYCPSGGTIARQGTSGSPTYTAWTLNSCTGGTIDGCWSETPFTATTPSASSTVLNDAQTMIVHDFATTQSGHGTQTVGNASTINGCKTGMTANAASGGTLTLRYRIGGVDTDTAKTITTTNAYYESAIYTTTADILRNQTVEIGAKQGANTVTQTVRDMWEICDFANASQAPKHRVIQQ